MFCYGNFIATKLSCDMHTDQSVCEMPGMVWSSIYIAIGGNIYNNGYIMNIHNILLRKLIVML